MNNEIENDIPDINNGKNPTISDKAWKGIMGFLLVGLIIFSFFSEKKEETEPKKTVNDFKFQSLSSKISIPKAEKEKPPVNPEPAPKSKEVSWQERKMRPPKAMLGGSNSQQPSENKELVAEEPKPSIVKKPTVVEVVSASMLPDLDFMITSGTYIECTVKNALDTAMAGMAVCTLPRDVYSENGNVLLLPRGTKFIGESLADVKAGQTRIATIWKQAQTRDGAIVSLESANGADTLGRTGTEGYTDTHFFQRFGAAIAVSLLETGSQVAAQNLIPRNGGGSNIYLGGGSNGGTQVVESILQQYANIPTSIVSNEGGLIQIAIKNNIDFSSIYELEVKP